MLSLYTHLWASRPSVACQDLCCIYVSILATYWLQWHAFWSLFLENSYPRADIITIR